MKKYILTTITLCTALVNFAAAQTEVKDKFLDTLRLGIRYQVQEFHTLNQKLDDNCNCDGSLRLNERALQGISASIYEPLTSRWSVGADLGGSFGTVMNDHRQYTKHSFVQMRVESFYHFFDSKSKLRPYLSGSIQLAANQSKALFSLPLGAGLRYQLLRGGSLHVQTAYDRGFSHAMAKNMITNIGFHVPLYKPKASSINGATLYPANANNAASIQWAAQPKTTAPVSEPASQISSPSSQVSQAASIVSDLKSQISNLPKKRLSRVIYFDTDKNGLNKAATEKVMAEVLAFMAENKGTRVYLYAHTDNVQSEAYNLRLSKSRADATAVQLMKQGISEDRIERKFYGESSPVASNAYESGRAANRRVEIVVM